MENFIVIESISSTPEWEQIFKTAIDICDSFSIVFPNGAFVEDNPLIAGKLDFENILNVTVSSWPKMEDSSVFSGELNDFSRNLFLQYAFNERFPYLWNFSFSKDGLEVLNVQDFYVCLIEPYPELLEMLNNRNINLWNL